MAQTIRILSPAGVSAERQDALASRLETLSGKVLSLVSNGWRSFLVGSERFGELAVAKYDAARVIDARHANASGTAPPDIFSEVETHADAAIVGLGH